MRAAGIPHAMTPAASATALYVQRSIIPAALAMLPENMDTPPARAMLMAIGLQESRFEHRQQIGGPARGFWQFEAGGGVVAVLRHEATRPLIEPVLKVLRYRPDECYHAIAHNDVLACVFARLLLWPHPKPLPTTAEAGWRYYLDQWRPGKERPETWDACWRLAWDLVEP